MKSLTGRQRKNVAAIIACCVLGVVFNPLKNANEAAHEVGGAHDLAKVRDLSMQIVSDSETGESETYSDPEVARKLQLETYTLDHVLEALKFFNTNAFVFVYYEQTDEFIALYDDSLRFTSATRSIYTIMPQLSFLLRRYFPYRFFGPGSGDWVALLSEGNLYEITKPDCKKGVLDCGTDLEMGEEFAPIFHFGNLILQSKRRFPSAVSMPKVDSGLLECFTQMFISGTVCDALTPQPWQEMLLERQGFNATFENLIPQVFWRGTDEQPLYGDYEKPNVVTDVSETALYALRKKKEKVAEELMAKENLRPTWRGAVLTAEAEVVAGRNKPKTTPWANIKLISYVDKGKTYETPTGQEYLFWGNTGLPTAATDVHPLTQAKYKYHLIIGGDSFTETFKKLSMPGLVFRVENDPASPIQDYITEHFTAGSHYVPVLPDLSDLKEKFEWAQNNTEEAEAIATLSTYYVRKMGLQNMVMSLSANAIAQKISPVIFSYESVPGVLGALLADTNSSLYPLMKCTGRTIDDCVYMADERNLPEEERFFTLAENVESA